MPKTLVPVVAAQHDGWTAVTGRELHHPVLQRALDLAPLYVVLLEDLRGGLRLLILGVEQLHGVVGVAAAGRVDQRRDPGRCPRRWRLGAAARRRP